MADITKTIEVVFGATNNTAGVLSSVGGGISDLSSNLQGVTGPLRSVSEDVLGLEVAILAAGVALAGFSVNAAGKFSDSVNEIGTLFNGTKEEISAFSDEILEYALTSTSSLDNITAATYNAVSAGVAYEDAIGALSQAERLAVAGKSDLNTSLDLLTSTMNSYGAANLDASEKVKLAADVSDALFIAIKAGKTTLPEMAAALGNVTSIAANSGVAFDELAAAVAALTASGTSTSEAVTQIKSALSNILKPSTQARDLAKELGIEFNATALKSKGFAGVLADVEKATGGNTEQLAILFGSIQGLGGVLSLTGVASEKFASTLDLMKEKTGAVTAAFNLMADNFGIANQKLQNSLTVSMVQIGKELLSGYSDIVSGLTEVFSSLSVEFQGDAFEDLFGYLDDASTKIGEFLQGVAKAFPEAFANLDFSELTSSFDNLGASLGDIFGSLDLTDADDLQKAVQFIITSFSTLTNVTSGVVDGLKPFIQGLVSMIEKLNSSDEATDKLIGQILGFASGLDRVLSLTGGVGAGLTAIASALELMAAAFIGKQLLSSIGSFPAILARTASASAATSAGIAKVASAAKLAVLAINPLAAALTAAATAATLYHNNEEFRNSVNDSIDDFTGLSEAAEKATEAYVFTAEQLENISKKQAEASLTAEDLRKAHNNNVLAEDALIDKNIQMSSSIQVAIDGMQGLGLVFDGATGSYIKAADGIAKADLAQQGFTKTMVDGVVTYSDGTGGINGFSSAITELADKTKEAKEESDEFQIKMEEIASNERIKNLEFAVDLKVAQVQADADKVIAAFESIAQTITSTNELISTLSTSEAPEWDKFGFNLKSQLQAAEKRAEEAHESQQGLMDAQIALLKAQAESLENGDALIKIEADGLEPELEAFMWRILDKLRVTMAQNYSDYLLGSGCTS